MISRFLGLANSFIRNIPSSWARPMAETVSRGSNAIRFLFTGFLFWYGSKISCYYYANINQMLTSTLKHTTHKRVGDAGFAGFDVAGVVPTECRKTFYGYFQIIPTARGGEVYLQRGGGFAGAQCLQPAFVGKVADTYLQGLPRYSTYFQIAACRIRDDLQLQAGVSGVAGKSTEEPIGRMYFQMIGTILEVVQRPAIGERLVFPHGEIPGTAGCFLQTVAHQALYAERHPDFLKFRKPSGYGKLHKERLPILFQPCRDGRVIRDGACRFRAHLLPGQLGISGIVGSVASG